MSSTVQPVYPSARPAPDAARHELLFLNCFRLAQALVYVGLALSPTTLGWPKLTDVGLARGVAVLFLLFALGMLSLTRRSTRRIRLAVSGALVVDIIAAVLAITAMHDARIGIAMMLAVNLAAGALILPLRLSCFFAALATLGVLGHSFLERPAQRHRHG